MSLSRETGLLALGETEAELVRLLGRLNSLLERVRAGESAWAVWIDAVAADYRASARNISHYWAIRQIDLRGLQQRLAAFGLSSLGRSEPHVEATLRLVRSAVLAMLEDGWCPPASSAVGADDGRELLRSRTVDLLGPSPANRETRIMVTLPSEAAGDAQLVRRLVERGMDVARINCAHDDPAAWRAMADHVRAAAVSASRSCLIAMDLAGPKLRTGPLQPGPRVVKLRPSRDALGHVLAQARGWLTAAENATQAPEPGVPVLPVSGEWLSRRRTGETLVFYDTRGAKRTLTVAGVGEGGVFVGTNRTAYVATGTILRVDGVDDPTEVGLLPECEQSLRLRPGDRLHVVRDCSPAAFAPDGVPQIGCTLPEVFDHARAGEKIFFDDGRVGGEIVAVRPGELEVRIEQAAESGSKLRAGKGINLPDTVLPVSALTEKDIADLAAVIEIADLVEMSFVGHPSDVEHLHDDACPAGRRPGGRRAQDRDATGVRAAARAAAGGDAPAACRRHDRARRPRRRVSATSGWPSCRRRSCGCARRRTCR